MKKVGDTLGKASAGIGRMLFLTMLGTVASMILSVKLGLICLTAKDPGWPMVVAVEAIESKGRGFADLISGRSLSTPENSLFWYACRHMIYLLELLLNKLPADLSDVIYIVR